MSEKDCDEQTMALEALATSAPIDTCKKEAVQTACRKHITESPWDPSDFVVTHEGNDMEKTYKLWKQRCSQMAKALPNDIMIPDHTPKIFLDTIRILAEKTDNLVDELWNYIKERKLVQSSLLLLAAQKQIRKHDWFNIIMYRIFKECSALRFENRAGDNDEARSARKQLEEIFHFVSIISHAGEALDKYIQAHSEVPHLEVLEHVSSILEEFGFSPKRDCIDIRNLHPYNCKISWGLHDQGLMHATKELTEMPHLNAAEEKLFEVKWTQDRSLMRLVVVHCLKLE